MAFRINNKRYNKLLSYRNNYFLYGSQMQNDPYKLNGRYSTPGIVSGLGGAQNPSQDYESPQITQTESKTPGLLGNLSTAIKSGFQSGALNGAASMIGGLVGSGISGGLESGAGNVINSLGDIASTIPGPWGAVASGALKVTSGLTNRLFGSKINQENVNNLNSTIDQLNSFQSDANSYDTLADNWKNTEFGTNFSDSYVGKDGLFSHKAHNLANQLRDKMEYGNSFVQNSLTNNANNITENIMNTLDANYSALGGFLNHYADGGNIHINPANRGKFNATKTRTGKTTEELTHSKNPLTKKRAIFAQNAAKWHHAFGGDLNTAGSDFPSGLTFINEGGTHETNPYEGVQIGVDQQGTPNLVEQGEAIYNDYVFSNRLTVPKFIRDKYKIRGNKSLTFADAVKKVSKDELERPNDPISQATLDAIMTDLAYAQEEVRIKNQVNMPHDANYSAYGGTLGNIYAGDGAGWQRLNMNNKTTGLNFGDPNFNPYDKDGIIDWNVMYGKDSPYMKRRQYVIDNWESKGVQDWLKKYVEGINKYNANRSGYTPMTVNDVTKDVFENRTFDKSWGGMHAGIDYAGDPSIKKANRYFLRSTDANGNPTVTPMSVEPWEGLNNSGRSFEEAYPNYRFKGKQERPIDNGTIYTDYYYDEDKPSNESNPKVDKLNLGTANESLRYAPVFGLGLATLTDALGLTNTPDYSAAGAIEAATRGGGYKSVAWNPIGNKLAYSPFDRDYYANKLTAQSNSALRSLVNQSGGNSGRTMAGILASDYNAQDKLGDLYKKAEEYNLEQRQKVEDFNRATNQANSTGMLQADTANQSAYANARDFYLKGITSAADIRQKAKAQADAAKSANLSGLLQSLGDIGYENKSMNMIRRLAEAGVLGGLSEGHPIWWQLATNNAKKAYKNKQKKV